MMTLNNINLLEKFRELKARPHTKSGFNAVVISETSPHRLGITSEGYPIFFIACSSSERVSDINLRLFKVLFNRRCTISDTTTESDIQGTFSMQKVIIKYKAFIISNIIVLYFLLRDKLGTKSNA